MITVGSYEAKTHLPRLIEKVLHGETVEITRHGVPVARLVPVEQNAATENIIPKLRLFRKGKRLGGISVKDLISEGRE